ncbi:hypothetical protein HNQ94_003103 [Salirhabdus euzebyi]|uniref:MORN repeat-containing protein n=1 Tax=Salirhabdus euzebyi TaxID=394506 RepID=A0A841Q8H5_9BACI|nr:hypothetical protein [Salirhabdus euzebyi]MBB6454614.1 hypothetical protein [Salirhabdus euzebyi]
MITLFSFLALLSIILLLIGVIKPSWIVLWKGKENRNRKTVVFYFSTLFLGSVLILSGFVTTWPFAFMLTTLILLFLFILTLVIGLIVPMKIPVFGARTRKRILVQHGLSVVVMFALLLTSAAVGFEEEEVDEKIFDATYVGDYKNGLKDGEGHSYNNSSYYKGEWKEDQRHGHGVEHFNFGYFMNYTYEGEFANNMENGHGQLVVHNLWNQVTYEGEWKDGKREGIGQFVGKDGSIYQGEWKNDAPNGTGKFTHPDGETYEGEVKDWQRNGYGKATLADGTVLEGQWINDELQE